MFKKVIEGFRAAFSDLNCQIDEEIAEDDQVVIRWSFSAMHKGSFLGFPATNKHVKWTVITIFRIVNGKVVQERGEEDYPLRTQSGPPVLSVAFCSTPASTSKGRGMSP